MVKFAHLLVLSALIVWLAGSGCVGNDATVVEETAPNVAEAGNGISEDSEMGLSQAEIQELDSDMAELENLLENASLEEEIVIEEL
ncbi:hypothetical protein EO95_00050 [Methanosarcina sp. 1.H.T.1A.1]|jgi:hypothetical protein|uniref:hypothetical protein n=1 Tax=unclassified Methanosarcina TaxID=2644672 RepID=UPI0006213CF1|nr:MULTISPECIES: hypothetical protein [unclassified Methanosarcina]KKG10716.1 hypothetical protein EO92_02755 [Methanosarcina sp. 2.H.A.1B.4]KKH49738.1 hypothetical protein EO93_01610 [Methanosarcina sp. 1.H.A.2.2]KKH96953.1 hypothetical protein EO95_00050 [Methanosarcina sp. 1.H.T.1A.1]